MGFGVFRRRPDYEKKFRSVFPTRIAGGGPPTGPWQKHLHPVPGSRFFVRPTDYSTLRALAARKLLLVVGRSAPVSHFQRLRLPLTGVFARPRDYQVQRSSIRRLPPSAVAAAGVVQQHRLLPPHRPEAFTRDTDYEANRLIRRLLPPTLAGGGPPTGPWLKHLHPLPAPSVFVRRHDYETNRTIRRVFPSVPLVATPAIVPRLKSPLLREGELWRYQVRRFLLPKAFLGVEVVPIPGAQLYEHDCIHAARFGASRFGFSRFAFAPHDVRMDGADAFYAWCKDGKEDESNWNLGTITAWVDCRDQETVAAHAADADIVVATEEGIQTARFGTARFGITRFGFVPDDVILDSTDTFYSWVKEKLPTDDGWSSVRSVDEE